MGSQALASTARTDPYSLLFRSAMNEKCPADELAPDTTEPCRVCLVKRYSDRRELLVIPALARSKPVTRTTPEWPAWPKPHQVLSGALFEPRPSLRKLVVLIDAELLAATDDFTLSPKVVLSGLLTHPYIKLLRYRDEGPFANTPRRSYGPQGTGLTAAEGWAELLPPDDREGRDLIYADVSGPIYTGIFGSRAEYARRDHATAIYRELDAEAAADRRERDALAAEVAEAVHADLYITERPYLFATQALQAQRVTLCRTPEALALVGLYLRSQNEYIIWRAADGSGSYSMNEGLYYWVGSRELLPTAWRWFSACVQESRAAGDDTLLDLGQSLLRLVQRALEARDRFHRTFSLPQNNDTARSVLSELDSILVSLMGAVDSSARVAHMVLGLPGNLHDAGWQRNQRWLPQIAAHEPMLAALFDADTPHYHTLTIVRLLRNTIHGQMMRTIAVQQGARPQETVIRLPGQDEATILTSIDALGGQAAWGVRSAANGSSLVDPGVFVERLFLNVLALLNAVMGRTPVERLSHVRLTPAHSQPPPVRRAGEADTFSERNRLSIRWQLGF